MPKSRNSYTHSNHNQLPDLHARHTPYTSRQASIAAIFIALLILCVAIGFAIAALQADANYNDAVRTAIATADQREAQFKSALDALDTREAELNTFAQTLEGRRIALEEAELTLQNQQTALATETADLNAQKAAFAADVAQIRELCTLLNTELDTRFPLEDSAQE
ncbi:hypothetical protein IJF89_01065 [Candidatus Saccharibacteria bacterium]|nr:hypothetical protein [Candidatus Saccharibacteria bacterium]